MKNQNLLTKIFALIAMLSGAIWLGAYAVRMMVSYQLFDIDMNLMGFVNDNNLEGILIAISPAINTTFILYITFIIAFTLFLFTSVLKFKENGWLFIITIIVYVTLPFEVYLMITDVSIIKELNYSEVINSQYAVSLIRERFITLSSFPIIIFLSYCSIIYFLIFKPFKLD